MKRFLLIGLIGFTTFCGAIDSGDYAEKPAEQTVGQTENDWSEDAFADVEAIMDGTHAMTEDERWMINLNKHFMQQDDINTAIIGLNALNMSQDRIDPKTQLPVLNVKDKLNLLQRVSEHPDANYNSLMLALAMCEEEGVKNHCSPERIKNQLFILEPDNINIYISDLAKAVNNEDAEQVNSIINGMSDAKYSHFLLSLSPEFISALDMYLFDHPFKEVFESTLVEMDVDTSSLDLEQLARGFLLMNYNLYNRSSIPEYQPLVTACSEFQKKPDACMSIAKTLQNNSDSLIMTTIGFNLEVKVQERFGDEKSLAASNQAQEAYMNYYKCLLDKQMSDQPMGLLTDPVMQKIINGTAHELTSMEQSVVYMYEKLKKAGAKDVSNPQSCGLRYIN